MQVHRPGWWIAALVAMIVLLTCFMLFHQNAGTDGGSGAEGSAGLTRVSRLSRPADGVDAGGLKGDRIKAKVRSLLDVRKGEVAILQLPLVDLEGRFTMIEPPNGSDSVSMSGIAGIFSRDQLAPILEEVLSEGHRLPAMFGNTDGLGLTGLGVELLEISESGPVSDLSIRYRDPKSGSSFQTAVTVFNGQSLLVRTNSSDDSAGFIIVTGSSPAAKE